MKKLLAFCIVFSIYAIALLSGYICNYNIEKELESNINNVQNNISVVKDNKQKENKIKLSILEVSETLVKYKKSNKDILYIDDAINEIASIKYVILKNKLITLGYDKNVIDQEILPYITNTAYDESKIYENANYSEYINKILDVVKQNNIEEYKKVKEEIYNDMLSIIDTLKNELKLKYDETQDFIYMQQIESLINAKMKLEKNEIKMTNYNAYYTKYIVINSILAGILSIIFAKVNKPKLDRSKRRNKRNKTSNRKLKLLEANHNKMCRINRTYAIAIFITSNLVAIISIINI